MTKPDGRCRGRSRSALARIALVTALLASGGCRPGDGAGELRAPVPYPPPGQDAPCLQDPKLGAWFTRSGLARDAFVVWDLDHRRPTLYCPVFAGTRAPQILPDGSRVAAGGNDGFLRVWSSSTGEVLQRVPEPGPGLPAQIRYGHGGDVVAMSGSEYGRCVGALPRGADDCQWRCQADLPYPTYLAETKVTALSGEARLLPDDRIIQGWTDGLGFDRTGRYLAVAEHYIGAPLPNAPLTHVGFQPRVTVLDTETGAVVRRLSLGARECFPGAAPRMIAETHFGPKLELLTARYWLAEGPVGIVQWDLSSGELLRDVRLPILGHERPLFAKNLRHVAVVDYQQNDDRDSVVWLYDMSLDRRLWSIDLPEPAEAFRFDANGESLLLGVGDSFELRDTETGRLLDRIALPHSHEFVHATAFDPTGQHVMLAGAGGLLLWERDTGTLHTLHDAATWTCSGTFSTDGSMLATACHDDEQTWRTVIP